MEKPSSSIIGSLIVLLGFLFLATIILIGILSLLSIPYSILFNK